MKKRYIVFILILIISFSGCVENTGVDVQIKQVIPLAPGTTIEITKEIANDLDFNVLDNGKPQDYALTNTVFRIPITIENNEKRDFDNVSIQVMKDSQFIDDFVLYSLSGKAFERTDDGFFKFDTKLLASQTNEVTIVGRVGDLPMNFTEAKIEYTVTLYEETESGQKSPIKNSQRRHKLIFCKPDSC